ncbi:hypothetical protein CDL12_24295 [Handroanthus impetiginosus]|uniref:Zinc finger PHD-type domain-containing protein n=1 Tax=Handroanthus impetiginosus TaxID=429701 RepID=A0A2G9GD12_9LAMI|nr:hypothetical protein CDL12_24295 [Handroanthus impetiginosus]
MENASMIEHFCHEHPLSLVTYNKKNHVSVSNEGETIKCYLCKKAVVVSVLSYVCCMSDDECSKIILHKRCAEMPRQMQHPSHPQHPLTLCIDQYGQGYSVICSLCRRRFKNEFCYHCYLCEFDIDISCEQLGMDDNYLFQDERFLSHLCHRHPLMLQRKPASIFLCDGCGTNEGEEMAYTCSACEFWVHKSCASFPMKKEIYHHHHPLSLAFSFPLKHTKYLAAYKCDICCKRFCPTYWVYFCNRCRFFAHVKCATRGNINLLTEKEEDDDSDHAIQLPISLSDFSKEVITSFIIRHGGSIINVDDMPTSVTMPSTNSNLSILFNYHKHPLSLIKVDDDDDNGKNEMKVCDLCITPILSPPYYSCADCKYFVHLTCYFLPKTISDDDPLCEYRPRHCQNHKLTLYASSEDKQFLFCWTSSSCSSEDGDKSLLFCRMCEKLTTGIVYSCQACDMMIDVKCASLPTIIKHASHPSHKLIKRVPGKGFLCVGCYGYIWSDLDIAYCCGNNVCYDFWIHTGCAMLPPSIKHRWDKHPLLLTFDASMDHPSDFYCEACEEEMHPKRGMYHCRECDQSFHTYCLPESGEHRNIKFGRQFEFGDLHPHPLTYNIVSLKYTCDRCGRIAYEKPGFECANSNCNYALCEYCGLEYLCEHHN